MTLAEFKAWLLGYRAAGGKDIEMISDVLDEVVEPAPFVYPTLHLDTGPLSPLPYDPLNPTSCTTAMEGYETS